jgi:protein SCO1/2
LSDHTQYNLNVTFRERVRALARCLAFACALVATPCGAEEKPIAEILEKIGISATSGAKVPLDLSLVDAGGKTVRLADLIAGKPAVLHLVYYQCPMLCKLSSDGLLRAVSTMSLQLGRDFTILTVSFDPREGPELSARAREVAIARCGRGAVENGWHFLTGDEHSVRRLCESVGFRYTFDKSTNQFAHASGAFVLTSDGTLSRYLSGVEYSPRDLRLGVVEASEGKVGSAADQVLLLCYMYDPITGKYGLAIMTAVRVAGVVTVCALGISIFMMHRREQARLQVPRSSLPAPR